MASGKYCTGCGKEAQLSINHLCGDCALSGILGSKHQQKQKFGPVYDKWLRRTKASLDELFYTRWPREPSDTPEA